MSAVFFALVHYPVYNREGDIVATSVTPLDLHDLGRIGATFGVKGFFIVNALASQRLLVAEMIYHWKEGLGGNHSPHRRRALSPAEVTATTAEAFDLVAAQEGAEPFVAATSARRVGKTVPAEELLGKAEGRPVLVLFGTGYGMTRDLMAAADCVLDPIEGGTDFNHLPVRAAMAIYAYKIFYNKLKAKEPSRNN